MLSVSSEYPRRFTGKSRKILRWFRACGKARQQTEEYTVPAATWAIFPGSGTNVSIQELEQRIVTEWLPTSGYEYGNAPDIEVYLNPDPADARFEVWIPVVKKAEKV